MLTQSPKRPQRKGIRINEKVKTELDNIVKTLIGTGIVTKIILFGSYAKGEQTPASDIDLCVLTPVKDRRPIEIMVDLRGKLRGVKKTPLDLFAYNQDYFAVRAELAGSFQHHIMKHGVVLYE